ncbi:MAG: twin-arginine translocation signal domain-containing protein [Limnohabitans sp.]|nr:twin-arginine translocation signal domain-containing protein [Limnohabitans sp.]
MDNKQPPASRRGFLMGAAAACATATAVTTLPTVTQQVSKSIQDKPMPERGGGYSLSEHVQRYYQTTRI